MLGGENNLRGQDTEEGIQAQVRIVEEEGIQAQVRIVENKDNIDKRCSPEVYQNYPRKNVWDVCLGIFPSYFEGTR